MSAGNELRRLGKGTKGKRNCDRQGGGGLMETASGRPPQSTLCTHDLRARKSQRRILSGPPLEKRGGGQNLATAKLSFPVHYEPICGRGQARQSIRTAVHGVLYLCLYIVRIHVHECNSIVFVRMLTPYSNLLSALACSLIIRRFVLSLVIFFVRRFFPRLPHLTNVV